MVDETNFQLLQNSVWRQTGFLILSEFHELGENRSLNIMTLSVKFNKPFYTKSMEDVEFKILWPPLTRITYKL